MAFADPGDGRSSPLPRCNEPMINVGNDHQKHRCQVVRGNHEIDHEENADIHICECKYMWIVG